MSTLTLLRMYLQCLIIILSISSVNLGLLIILYKSNGKSPIANNLSKVMSKRYSKSVSVTSTSFIVVRSNFLNCFVNFSTTFNFIFCNFEFFWQISKWPKVSSVLLQKLHLVFAFAYRSGRCFFLFSKVGSSELMSLKRKQLSACSLVEICFLSAL